MKIRKTQSGNKFDEDELKFVARTGGDNRGTKLYQTPKGQYLAYVWSCWQGESSYWEEWDKERAYEFCIDHLRSQEELEERFSDLIENEELL